MNTNRINNKNLKRIAIAAGTTAGALFLSAGLVACDSKTSDTVAAPADAAQLVEVLENVAADITPTLEDVAANQSEVLPALETATKSVVKPNVKSTKVSKKKSAATGGSVILDAPTASESAPAVETTVAPVAQQPAAQQADNTVVNTPIAQPTVEQPAAQQQPATTEQAATTASAPASSGSTTAITVPKVSGTPTLSSQLAGKNLADLLAPTISVPCLPGFNC